MKTKYIKQIFYFIIILIYFPFLSIGQTPEYNINFNLNTDPGNVTKEYVGRDYIKLSPGFHYKAENGNAFNGRIDENLFFQADYNTQQTTTDLYNNHTLNTGLTVGAIAGNGTVSPSGGSIYNIPLEIAPGVNNLVPQLSINYNSQSGNNFLGWGWSLGGLSAISRVPNTIYHDGFAKGINYDSDSRYAIDGNRIIDIDNSGNYHTESETFSNIEIVGAYENPTKFIVTAKNGFIYTYNFKVNLGAYGTQWLVTNITDPYNNYISFTYDQAYGTAWPVNIDYTGRPGVAPFCSIKFFYEERDDKTLAFVKIGSPSDSPYLIKQTRILNKIKVLADNMLYREYGFNYQKTTSDLYSRLVEITMKISDGSQVNSTVIDWGADGGSRLGLINGLLEKNPTDYEYFTGDFEGDGKTNVIEIHKYTDFVIYKPNGTSVSGVFVNDAQIYPEFFFGGSHLFNDLYNNKIVADFNGDGLDDIVCTLKKTVNLEDIYEVKVYYSSGTGSFFSESNSASVTTFASPVNVMVGEFNGDGLPDLVIYRNEIQFTGIDKFVMVYCKNSSDMDFTNYDAMVKPFYDIKLLDFNGDGLTDILFTVKSDPWFISGVYYYDLQLIKWEKGLRTESTFSHFTHSTNSDFAQNFFVADFNGDGKADLLMKNGNTVDYNFYISDGLTFLNNTGTSYSFLNVHSLPPFFNIYQNIVLPADFNGDGKTELMTAYWNPNTKTMDAFEIVHLEGNLVDEVIFKKEQFTQSFLNRHGKFILGDFNNDGALDILPFSFNNTSNFNKFFSFKFEDLSHAVTKIKNGMDIETKFNYRLLNDPICYTKTPAATHNIPDDNNFPVRVLTIPMTVVSSIEQSSGIASGSNLTEFHYSDLTLHTTGKGFLGFKKINSNSLDLLQNTESVYNVVKTAKYCTMELHSQSVIKSGPLVDTKIFTYDYINNGNKSIFQKLTNVQDDHFVNGVTNTTYSYDSDGNVTSENTLFADGNSIDKTSSGFQAVIPVNNLSLPPSLPTSVTVTKTIDNDAYTVTTGLTWDPGGKQTGSTANDIQTTNTYFPNGNLSTTTKSGAGKIMTETFIYGSCGRFIFSKTDPLQHITKMEYNNPFGLVSKVTNINNQTTSYTYDGLGRIRSTSLPDGQYITNSIDWFNGGPEFYTMENSSGYPYKKTIYDRMGRTTGSETQGFGGNIISTATTYNALGEVVEQTRPDGISSNYTYDGSGRILSESITGMGTTSYSYSGRTTYITSPTGNFSKTYNCLNQLISATDNGGTTGYTYYGHGGINTVTGAGAGTSVTYDPNGFQQTLTDPDAGTTHYTYNALGQLITQIIPANTMGGSDITTSMQYDIAGRCTSKTVGGVTYNYEYDVDLIGTLSSVTSSNNMGISYKYNQWGDLLQKTETIGGQDYITKYTYDNKHHIIQKTYPSGFAVSYNYDNLGFLNEILPTGGGSAWKALAIDEMMHVTQYTVNGININNTFSSLGYLSHTDAQFNVSDEEPPTVIQNLDFAWDNNKANLLTRYDNVRNSEENFLYDVTQRCTSAVLNVNGTVTSNLTMSYFDNGNIQSKSDVGDFGYGENAGPHALTSVQNFTSNIPSIDQTIHYNAYNKVASVEEGQYHMTFAYGTEAERRIVEMKDISGNTLYTKYYADDYEKIVSGNGITRELHYIPSPSGLCAIYVKNSSSVNDSLYLIFNDHLGSIAVITDQGGNPLQRINYDTWGKRSIVSGTQHFIFDRGYTGHEHIEAFNLINMNGRMYDPVLGRFLIPDNYAQGLESQKFNRYSYCANNPLKYTDPSGESFLYDDAIVAGIGFVVGWGSYGLATGNLWSKKAAVAGLIGAGVAVVGWNTFGAGVGAVTTANTSWGLLGEAASLVGSNSGFFIQYGLFTGLNAMAHTNQLQIADQEKGNWEGVKAFGVYAASAMLSVGLDPSEMSKMDKIRLIAGVLITDNLSDNMNNGQIDFHSLHAGFIGYDSKRHDPNWGGVYTILSKGLTEEQRFDMGFETLLILSQIPDSKTKWKMFPEGGHRWGHRWDAVQYFRPVKVGYYASKFYNTFDAGYNTLWYYNHFNIDGTAKY